MVLTIQKHRWAGPKAVNSPLRLCYRLCSPLPLRRALIYV